MSNKHHFTTVIHCHTGPIEVMRIGNVSIWAGSRTEITGEPWDLRIRISSEGAVGNATSVQMDRKAAAILPPSLLDIDAPPTLDVQWPDFGIPELGWEWWSNLVSALESMPTGDVGIHCDGGHGRTGTALAILASMAGLTEGDPVQYIRDRYCEDAVESSGQIGYIEDITGVKVEAESSWGKKYVNYGAYEHTVKSAAESATAFDPTLKRWRQLPNGQWIVANDAEYLEKENSLALAQRIENNPGLPLPDPHSEL